MSASKETLGFVMGSQSRRRILGALGDGAKIPTEIHEEMPETMSLGNVSRHISELREEDLVELLVPEDQRKGRLYGLTDEGELAVEWLHETGRLNGSGPQ